MAVLVLLSGCSRAARGSSAGPTPTPEITVVSFEGTCDASGAVSLDATRFVVADDENNVLRVYDADAGGKPLHSVDVSPELRLQKANAEADLEAGARLGNVAVWLSSHGRDKKGRQRPDRLRFFGIDVSSAPSRWALVGQPYQSLLDDFSEDARFAPFNLRAAAELPPNVENGLNLEGMTEVLGESDALWLGFRNPVPGGRALLALLRNAREVLTSARARFGDPVLLDLDGLGIRGLSSWRGRYLVIGGAISNGVPSRLFSWKGPPAVPEPIVAPQLAGLNPEAFFTPEERGRVMVLSDDGNAESEGRRCKDQKDPTKKRFRGVWLTPPP